MEDILKSIHNHVTKELSKNKHRKIKQEHTWYNVITTEKEKVQKPGKKVYVMCVCLEEKV